MINKYLIQEQLRRAVKNAKPNTKENSVLVIDTNLGLEHALGIAKSGKYKVYYAIINGDPYPKLEDEISGYGFNTITKISDFGKALDKVSTVVIIDSGFGYLADWLRSKGYNVISADHKTERLELDRVYVRKVLSELGIDIPPGQVVKGIDGVIQAVKNAKGKVFIKVSRYRGGVETFGTDDPYEAEFMLTQGGFRIVGDSVYFVVEQELNGVEIGIDTWFNGETFIPIVAETIEIKGVGNATKFTHINDSVWKDVLLKLEPFLRKNGYVGMFCLEGFYNGNTIYVTDVTPRFPFICSYAYPKVITNYGDFMVNLAKGEIPLPEIENIYSVQIGVYTDMPNKWKIIDYNGNDIDWIAFRRVIKKNGKYWFVPGDPLVAAGISSSNDLNQAVTDAIKRAKNISVIESYTSGYDFAADLNNILTKAEKLGYHF